MQAIIKYEYASNGYIISTDKVKMVAKDMDDVTRIIAKEIASAIQAAMVPEGFIKIQIEPKKEDL
jgi:hypothetical protein